MSPPRCATCRWWAERDESLALGTEAGECRAGTPQPLSYYARHGDQAIIVSWPVTAATDYCGAHRPREATHVAPLSCDQVRGTP